MLTRTQHYRLPTGVPDAADLEEGELAIVFDTQFLYTKDGGGVVIQLGNPSFWTASGDDIYNNNAGNVGIGTITDPSSYFGPQFVSQTNITIAGPPTGNSGLLFNPTDNKGGLVGGFFYAHTGDALGTFVNGAERMRIIADGNVGIGTTDPKQTLHVEGKAVITSDLQQNIYSDAGWKYAATGRSGWARVTSLNNDNYFEHVAPATGAVAGGAAPVHTIKVVLTDTGEQYWQTNNTERMRVTSVGSVQIGTTGTVNDDFPLVVKGDGGTLVDGILIRGTDGQSRFLTFGDSTQDDQAFIHVNNVHDMSISAEGFIGLDTLEHIEFTTGNAPNTEKMRIAADGKVGLGITAPVGHLDVHSGDDVGDHPIIYATRDPTGSANNMNEPYFDIVVDNSLSWGIATLMLKGKTSRSQPSYIQFGDELVEYRGYIEQRGLAYTYDMNIGTEGNLVLQPGQSEAMRITALGDVGIGTTNPPNFALWRTLELDGDAGGGGQVYFSENGVNQGVVYAGNGPMVVESLDNNPLVFSADGNEAMRILVNGNVGIGTNNPLTKLAVYDLSGNTGFEFDPVNFGTAIGLSAFADRDAVTYGSFHQRASEYLWHIVNDEAMRIDSDGNVGINKTDPSAPLHVVGKIDSGIGSGEGFSAIFDRGLYNYGFVCSVGAADQNNGYCMGTPTNPWAAGIEYKNNNGHSLWVETGGYFQFMIGGAQKMGIDSDGKVGIGTTSPDAELTVVGEVQISEGTSNTHLNYNGTGQNYISHKAGQFTQFRNGNAALASFTANVLGTGTVYTSGGAFTGVNPSDRNLKKDITPIAYALDDITALRPVVFRWKEDEQIHYGFIAQDVQEVLPEIVQEENGLLGIRSDEIVPILTKAIQEQQATIETLTQRIEDLENG